ncbi:MAG: hypothetical protein LBE24_08195 [Methylobacillus sp.]|jgi:hypothetical protein|nr:hypothetical protein [Methylobacillus sp.]
MEAGHSIEILNPYEWMPGHGENSVEISTEGLSLIIVVTYDGDNGVEQRKKITFTGVNAFYKASFPGPYMLRITHSVKDKENISLGSLVEFPRSEAARAWTDYWSKSCGIIKRVKHYTWMFTSENLMVEVFAEGVQWEDHSS